MTANVSYGFYSFASVVINENVRPFRSIKIYSNRYCVPTGSVFKTVSIVTDFFFFRRKLLDVILIVILNSFIEFTGVLIKA